MTCPGQGVSTIQRPSPQFSEESVSSVEPSLSTSILLLWWMFLLGEAFRCASFRPTALPLLLLPGLTEI